MISEGLKQYITPALKSGKDEIKNIEAEIVSIEENNLGFESNYTNQLIQRLINCTYSRINPDFLSQSINNVYNDEVIRVPKFSVYDLSGSMELKFIGFYWRSETFRKLNDEMKSHLFKSLELSPYVVYDGGSDLDMTNSLIKNNKKQVKKQKKKLNDYQLKRNFSGLMTKVARTEISKANKLFGVSNVFLIEEESANEKKERLVMPNTLVIATQPDKTFYITEFKKRTIDEIIKE